MKFRILMALASVLAIGCSHSGNGLSSFPAITEKAQGKAFPLSSSASAATICIDTCDARVVEISAGLLADDVERLTGLRPAVHMSSVLPDGPAIVAGTIGNSTLVDSLAEEGIICTDSLKGKWESFLIQTVRTEGRKDPLLVIAGSDRRGTAFGLMSLSEAAGVSPWYWWADVTPQRKKALYVQPGLFLQKEPDVQYRGIFINDERFGGWARWVEQTFDK